jgi:phosphoglycerate dehydrogenase-like enzyme
MSTKQEPFRIAVLDDYQHVALSLADWSVLDGRATVTVFDDHVADADAVVERLQPFDIVCVMRERTPMTRTIIERLPKLRLIASTALRNASIDLKTAEERGVQVVHTGYTSAPTIELTWALILGSARNLVAENASLRSGGWQRFIGDDMAGRTLGVLGLGNVGGAVAQIGKAFGMNVIAWSQNLTAERAAEANAELVSKKELFRRADVVSVHVVLSDRTRGLVGAPELAIMKPTARLVNTSRGPIVVEADLIAALKAQKIAGAAIDVFDQEPLPLDHPFRTLPKPTGHATHRLRLARPLHPLPSGRGREHPQLAQRNGLTRPASGPTKEHQEQMTIVIDVVTNSRAGTPASPYIRTGSIRDRCDRALAAKSATERSLIHERHPIHESHPVSRLRRLCGEQVR